MSRSTRRRFSRWLIGLMCTALAVGTVAYIYKASKIHVPDKVVADAPPPLSAGVLAAPARVDDPMPVVQTVNPANAAQTAANITAPPTTAPTSLSASFEQTPAVEKSDSADPVIDGKAKLDAGQLLQARVVLNTALQSGKLSPADMTAAKGLLSQISKTVVFSPQQFAEDPYGGTYTVNHGDSMAKIADAHDCTWELLSHLNNIEPRKLRAGATIKVIQGPFFAVVSKKQFTMDLYLGGLPGESSSMYVTTFQVGLGRDDSTPTGTWMVEPHKKIRHPVYYSPRGEGVIPAEDPKNPLGGYWIGLTGTDGQAVGKMSYGIHGTIEPDSIGKQSSMGCIRMRNEDVALVFEMLVEGKSMVVVAEQTSSKPIPTDIMGGMSDGLLAPEGKAQWLRCRRAAWRRWAVAMAIALGGGLLFIVNLRTDEPSLFALMALIPILSLRAAWQADHCIRLCDQKINPPAQS